MSEKKTPNHTAWETVERGIRRYQHLTRKHGVKFDVYYALRFKLDGKSFEEGLGWTSEGWTLEKARTTLAGLRTAQRTGQGEATLQEKRANAATKRKMESDKPTIAKLWEYYYAANDQKASMRTDKCNYKYLEQFKTMLPEQINTAKVDALSRSLFAAGKAPQTVKHIIALLRRIIRWGVEQELCDTPPRLVFHLPKIDNAKTECLSPEQAKRLFIVLDEEDDQIAANIVRLALATGMRRGALLALEWRDVDFQRGFITLRGEAAKKGRTEKIPLNDNARSILENTPRFFGSPIVFHNGKGVKRADVNKFLRRVRAKTGLPDDFRMLHGLRHTFASWLASSGSVDLFTLQKLMTHDSPQMTQRYSHLADDAMKRAADVASVCLQKAMNAEPSPAPPYDENATRLAKTKTRKVKRFTIPTKK